MPIIISNGEAPLVIPSGKQAVFRKMDAQFEMKNRITTIQLMEKRGLPPPQTIAAFSQLV